MASRANSALVCILSNACPNGNSTARVEARWERLRRTGSHGAVGTAVNDRLPNVSRQDPLLFTGLFDSTAKPRALA